MLAGVGVNRGDTSNLYHSQSEDGHHDKCVMQISDKHTSKGERSRSQMPQRAVFLTAEYAWLTPLPRSSLLSEHTSAQPLLGGQHPTAVLLNRPPNTFTGDKPQHPIPLLTRREVHRVLCQRQDDNATSALHPISKL